MNKTIELMEQVRFSELKKLAQLNKAHEEFLKEKEQFDHEAENKN